MLTIFKKIIAWHLEKGFAPEFKPVGAPLVEATLQIYKDAMKRLLPTPTRSHYLFNLRDFSRVIQGVLLGDVEAVPDVQMLKRLWVHEVRYRQCDYHCLAVSYTHL